MALQPVNRRSVPEDVFEQIVAEVLSGEMQPGEALPSERRLAEVLGVSRPAVREALKRLTAAGLVEVRQGDATTVRDFRRHAGLDLLPRLLIRAGELDLSVVRSILETRLAQRAQGRRAGGRAAAPGTGRPARRRAAAAGRRGRSGRAAAPRADVLGPRRRRRRFDRIPADVQHASRHLRARAARAGRCDGRRGRPARRPTASSPTRSPPAIPTRPESRAGPTRTRHHGAAQPRSTVWRNSDDHRDRAHRTRRGSRWPTRAASSGNTPPRG